MNIKTIKSARKFEQQQGWEDGPKDEVIDWLIARNEELLAALESLKHADGCFCEAAFAMPDGSHPSHSIECIRACTAIAQVKGEAANVPH